MIIKFTNLPVGIHAFQFEKTAKELQLGEPFVDKLNLDCHLDKSQHQIVVKCNLTISTELICDRCNDDFNRTYESEFTLLYLFDKSDVEIEDVNVKLLSPTDDKINLTEDVIDYAHLSIPMKKLCKDNCKGLCIKCGENLNINECKCSNEPVNPTWEPLLKLKDKLN